MSAYDTIDLPGELHDPTPNIGDCEKCQQTFTDEDLCEFFGQLLCYECYEQTMCEVQDWSVDPNNPDPDVVQRIQDRGVIERTLTMRFKSNFTRALDKIDKTVIPYPIGLPVCDWEKICREFCQDHGPTALANIWVCLPPYYKTDHPDLPTRTNTHKIGGSHAHVYSVAKADTNP
jgi:hypothetical protein